MNAALPCAVLAPLPAMRGVAPHTQASELTSHTLGVLILQLGKCSFLDHLCMMYGDPIFVCDQEPVGVLLELLGWLSGP